MEISKAEIASASSVALAAPQELMGAEIMVKALQAEGVKYLWGYPGGAVLYIYDALYKQNTIEHVLVRHEQAAVHAADGYARATGEVGVALVTSGPGVTNAVTGIATAYMDSIPLVVLTGQVPTHAIGLDAFQECDTVGITRPIVKHNFLVKDAADLALTIKKAFHIARSGRPGPVVVDIPKDVSFKKTLYTGYPEDVTMRSYNPVRKGHSGQIRKALGLLMGAKRPYIYTGGGVLLSNASDEVRALVNMIGAPCTSTLMGLGAIPASDPKFLGMLGMHGTIEANNAMQHCDVLIAIGARFDDRVIGNPKHFAQNERKIVHIDIDPSSISKRVKVDVPIVGDCRLVIEELVKTIREMLASGDTQADISDWKSRVSGWQEQFPLYYPPNEPGEALKPQFCLEKLRDLAPAGTILCSGVGQHQMWSSQYWHFNEPYTWVNSGGLGTMGFSIPAAIGAKVGCPDRTVWAVDGDGCFQMTAQELVTASVERIPIKVAVLNNSYLGMVRQWQEMFYEERYSEVYLSPELPDFVKWAEAMGCVGIRVESPEEVEPAIALANSINDRSVVIEFRVDAGEKVFPMVPAGSGNDDVLLHPNQNDRREFLR